MLKQQYIKPLPTQLKRLRYFIRLTILALFCITPASYHAAWSTMFGTVSLWLPNISGKVIFISYVVFGGQRLWYKTHNKWMPEILKIFIVKIMTIYISMYNLPTYTHHHYHLWDLHMHYIHKFWQTFAVQIKTAKMPSPK